MLGLQAALPILSEGRRYSPRKALELGLIHALAPSRDSLLEQARAWIATHPQAHQPWDDPKWRIPGGTPSSPAVASVLPIAPAVIQQKTRGNYPAPEAILAAAVEGAQVDFDTALRIESRYLARLAVGQVAKNMISTLFFQMNELKAGGSRPQGVPRWKPTRIGILGAGMMGAGIAWACANRGLNCVLKDVDLDRAERGKAYSAKLLAGRVEKGRMSAEEAQAVLGRIHATAQASDLAGCDLVIEAVFEDRRVKAQVTQEAEAVLGPEAIMASNTSTLPISGLARASARPERFIGLHFFSPVDKMDLVEIIKGEKTSSQTLAQAFDFVQAIGKTPIVVNDSRGFYTSRVFGTFVNEGMALLGEGAPAALIENAAMQAGMPVGPLAVLDEVSLKLADDVLHQELADLERAAHDHAHDHSHDHSHDHAHDHAHDHSHDHSHNHAHDHAHDHAHAKTPAAPQAIAIHRKSASHAHSHKIKSKRMPEAAVYVLEKMAHGYKRLGRAYGAGFYDYPEGGRKSLWPGLSVFQRGARKAMPTVEDIRERLLYVQALETLRCLDEGVLESVRDANIGSILGWGFPAWAGGTVQYVNHVGVQRFVERARQLASLHGERFAPPDSLIARATQGETL
jgi:3-hydroxyacyl-CoA dehydrogenase